jgi:integrase
VGRKRRRTLSFGGSPVTVFKRGKKWVCKIYMGRVNGKERQLWKTFTTRDEAETYAARLRLDGVPLAPARLTFGEWLDQWLATDRPPSEATALRYEQTVRLHLKPVLGHIRLLKLGPGALEHFMERQKERGYSIATIAQNIRVISTALHCAMRRRLIITNPVTLIHRPQPVPSSTAHWDVEQVKLFLGAVQRSPLASLFISTVATGLRSCEIRALREEDYDPPVLHVRQKVRRVPGRWVFEETLKSRYSRRTLTLPVFAQAALATQVTGRRGLLWHQENGEPLPHYTCQNELDRITKEAGIPRLTLHGLRHTQATVLAHLGVAPQIIQRRLGHSKIGTTMDIYAHEMPNEDAGAAAILDHIFGKDERR